jgi:hypothetical protein
MKTVYSSLETAIFPPDHSVFSTDHHSGQPYIMWAGAPYEHIMMPVTEGENTQ